MTQHTPPRLPASRSHVQPAAVPAAQARALAVTLRWGDTLLEEWLFQTPKDIVLGADDGADVRVLDRGAAERRRIAGVNERGGWELLVPPGGLRLGHTTLHLALTEAAPKAARERFSWSLAPYLAGSAGFALGIFGLFLLLPPHASAISVDREFEATRVASYLAVPAEAPPPPPVSGGASGGGLPTDAGKPAEEGTSVGGAAPRGPENHAPNAPRVVRAADAVASTLGTLAALGGALGGDDSPWTAAVAAQTQDAPLGLGGPSDHNIGGLGLNGVGRGTCKQPPCGDTIAVGAFNTHSDVGPGPRGFGPGGPGGDLRPHDSRVPKLVRSDAVVNAGTLSREHVQRVIRRNVPKFKFCFESALRSTPDLEGRVLLSFVVKQDGAVMSAELTHGTLGNQDADRCLREATLSLTFDPSPGVTAVTYPLVFQAAP